MPLLVRAPPSARGHDLAEMSASQMISL